MLVSPYSTRGGVFRAEQTVRRCIRALSGFPLAVALVVMAIPSIGAPRPSTAGDASIVFQLPGQPLERALVAYGRAANIQVLYDASLVSGKRSTAVQGRYAAAQALEILLRGTGLRARYASTRAITLSPIAEPTREVLALDVMSVQAAPMLGDSRRFDAYGQALQNGILDALRRDRRTSLGDYDVTLRVWLSAEGEVERTALAASTGNAAYDSAIVDVLRGVRAGQAPPPGMPQPVSFRFQARAMR